MQATYSNQFLLLDFYETDQIYSLPLWNYCFYHSDFWFARWLRRVGHSYLSRFENEPMSAYSANAFLGQSNIGGMSGTDPAAAPVELVGMVVASTGISLLWGDFDKLPKGPSTYRGWHFVARP